MLCFNHGLKHHASSNEHCGDVLAGDHGAFPLAKLLIGMPKHYSSISMYYLWL